MVTSRYFLSAFLGLMLALSAFPRSILAQDAPANAEPSKDQTPKEEAPKEEPPKAPPAPEEPAGLGEAKPIARTGKKKSTAKKKPYDYERSKYKSKEPSQNTVYRFTEKGEPIINETKKRVPKKKKRSEPPDAETHEGACGSEGTCAEKKSEAVAL